MVCFQEFRHGGHQADGKAQVLGFLGDLSIWNLIVSIIPKESILVVSNILQ